MTAAAPPLDALGDSLEQESLRVSYWSVVWGQLRKKRTAVWGMWSIAFLFAAAVYAPLISLGQPLYWSVDGHASFPLFAALFNRLLFENSVDLFFNLLMVLSPLYLVIYLAVRARSGTAFGVVRGRLIGWMLLSQLALFLLAAPSSWGPWPNPLYLQRPIVDYSAARTALEAEGVSVSAVFPMRTQHYRDTDPVQTVQPPSERFWLGTDLEGRDVFARMLYGTRISLTIGVVAVSIYVLIGVILGAFAGYFGGWIDVLVSRAIEVMICFPSFFLILTLAAFVENRSIFHVMVIIGVTSWPGVARLIRAEFLKHRQLDYAQAALALGIPRRRIIFGHILPNAIAPVLVTATFGVASAILTESALAFLGIGDPSAPSWGETLNSGRVEEKLWLILAPGFAIFFVVSVFNLVGEGLRDALDPKLRE